MMTNDKLWCDTLWCDDHQPEGICHSEVDAWTHDGGRYLVRVHMFKIGDDGVQTVLMVHERKRRRWKPRYGVRMDTATTRRLARALWLAVEVGDPEPGGDGDDLDDDGEMIAVPMVFVPVRRPR
jgi:hypothetical protein